LVSPARLYSFDLFGDRKITIIDFIAFVIYMAAMFLLYFYD